MKLETINRLYLELSQISTSKTARELELEWEKDCLLNACQAAYRKHHVSDESIGWDELSSILLDALCNAMGDNGFQKWIDAVSR